MTSAVERCRWSCLGALVLAVSLLAPHEAYSTSPAIVEFRQGFSYSYGDFEKAVTVADGVAHIRAKASRGGAAVTGRFDLSPFADHSPGLRMRVGPGNRAEQIRLFFEDSDKTRYSYLYGLSEVPTDRCELVLPSRAASTRLPNEGWLPGRPRLDLSNVRLIQIQGEWTGQSVDVYVESVEMVAPTARLEAQRRELASELEARAERERREAERREREKQEALTNPQHREDDPAVTGVCAVAPDILCVTIQARHVSPLPQVPYDAQSGDEVRESGNEVLAWHHGRIVKTKKDLEVHRDTDGGKEMIGWLVINEDRLWPGMEIRGHELTRVTLTEPAAYRISSTDDPRYRAPVRPDSVHVKSKPTNHGPRNELPVRYRVFLQLPQPLQVGRTYRVHFTGLNTRQHLVEYAHHPTRARSEAIHVSHVGYRPDDPFKKAYLSTWMGTGGALAYAVETFQLLEASTGEVAYEGPVKLGLAADEPEHLKEERNYTKTNVYHMDFSGFRRPGTYRVHVPGIGVSYPFRIAEDAWAEAFRVSMKGFLHHRSGIELGTPFTDYVRPRCFHPADGTVVFRLDNTYWDGETGAVRESLERLLGPSLDSSRLETHPGAWGGYMDAGDWDRRSQHLMPTYLHLELCDLFPAYFARLRLALPPGEAANRLPDVLDEALWNLSLYRRLQRKDGGVGGGVESTAHPRTGECSWQESLCVGTFAPDPETTLRYAACAAKMSRLIAPHDAELARTFRESAERAWRWAEANAERYLSRHEDKLQNVRRMRALAAVELLRLTEEERYHPAVRESLTPEDDFSRNRHAWFAYALLPDELADPELKRFAVEGYRDLADTALEFARGNAFSITTDSPQLPMIGYVGYYSVPGMTVGPSVPRAHYLTGEEKYLAGTVAACNFSAGANPMNVTLTTGLGHDYPRAPLHIDSRRSAQRPPEGITVFGPSDPALSTSYLDWAHKWKLGPTMIPDSRTWPAAEFYADIYTWPAMNEYTVHQTFGPTSYHWGYLAARE